VFIDELFELELIPMLTSPKDELEVYSEQIKERFLNPFANHQLTSILLNSVSKFSARLLPLLKKYIQEKQAVPKRISASLAALILLYRGDKITPVDNEYILDSFTKAWEVPDTVVNTILKDESLWGMDLTLLPDLEVAVTENLQSIEAKGVRSF